MHWQNWVGENKSDKQWQLKWRQWCGVLAADGSAHSQAAVVNRLAPENRGRRSRTKSKKNEQWQCGQTCKLAASAAAAKYIARKWRLENGWEKERETVVCLQASTVINCVDRRGTPKVSVVETNTNDNIIYCTKKMRAKKEEKVPTAKCNWDFKVSNDWQSFSRLQTSEPKLKMGSQKNCSNKCSQMSKHSYTAWASFQLIIQAKHRRVVIKADADKKE